MMPSRPPGLKAKPKIKPSNWTKRENRHARGYGRAHELMRELVLGEEPLCRACKVKAPPLYRAAVVADHIVPKAEGGSDERENYQGLCDPCHRAKTARESANARRRARR